jgi:hypothetical protein
MDTFARRQLEAPAARWLAVACAFGRLRDCGRDGGRCPTSCAFVVICGHSDA